MMNFIRRLPNGKSQIIKDEAFCNLLNGEIPNSTQLITKLISDLDVNVHSLDPSVTKDALNNVHGDWYEWLLAISAWNYSVSNSNANIALLTPNVSQFDVARLYDDKLFFLIQDLKSKVLTSSSVNLISSNPDFVIIDRKLANTKIKKWTKITKINKLTISKLENLYKKLIGMCNFEDIHGYISVKTSFRPDRRLQIPHEGSLMKAIYTHMQTREWILNPKGLKYYAISTKVGSSDRNALKTVATHSITTVQSIPQAAVDEVFEINSLQQAEAVFAQILIS